MGGFFIAVEGIDGAGKTTLCEFLKEKLQKRGYPVVLTREPTDGQYGRELKRRTKKGDITPEQELELFMKDRKEHVERVIVPSLKSGRIVISDRYYLSSCAYQGARGIDYREICRMHSSFPSPDLVIFLDISPKEALQRKEKREEHFEEENFLKRVREIYLQVLKSFNHIKIEATMLPEEIGKKAMEAIEKCLKK